MRLGLGCAFLLMTLPGFAADSPWDGTWKVNEAKSRFTGTTFTISEKSGMMHFSNGGPVEYDFACDGKDYPTTPEHTFACRNTGEMSYATVSKAKGQETSRAQREISRDGKTMTVSATGTGVDGSTFNEKETFARVAGSQGMAGTWKSVKDEYNGPETMKVTLAGGLFRAEYPSEKTVFEGKLDGSSTPVTGPRVPPGATTEMKAEGPRAIGYVSKLGGKVIQVGREVLSADGKVITDTSWTPGKESEKVVAVFEKQ